MRPDLSASLELVTQHLGFRVFPCHNKEPLVRWRRHENQRGAEDWTELAAGGDRAVEAYGIALPDDVVVLDVDDIGAWEEWLAGAEGASDWSARHTLTVTTPRGGYHIYLRRPEGARPVPIAQGRPCAGVDVRTAGGYVIGPGSATESGTYAVLEDETWEIAECPAWLWAALQPRVPDAVYRRDAELAERAENAEKSPLRRRIAEVNAELAADEAELEALFVDALEARFGEGCTSRNGHELHGPCPRCMDPERDFEGGARNVRHDRFRLQRAPREGGGPVGICRQCGRRTDLLDLVHVAATGRVPESRGDVYGTLVFLGRSEGLEGAQTLAARFEKGNTEVFAEKDLCWDFPMSDLGNAERLVHCYGTVLRHVPELSDSGVLGGRGAWATWDEDQKVWTHGDAGRASAMYDAACRAAQLAFEGPLSEHDKELLGKSATEIEPWHRERRATLLARKRWVMGIENARPTRDAFTKAHGIDGVVTPLERFDRNPWLLNTPAGPVDLRSGELLAPDPEHLLMMRTRTPYVPGAASPRWQRFLQEVMGGDQELIRFLQRFVGSAVLGEQYDQMLAVFHGTGCNGKSVFVDVVAYVLGSYARPVSPRTLLGSSAWLQSGSSATDDVASLVGARFVHCEEPPQGAKLDEATVKAMLSGQEISARRVYGKTFSFRPQFNPIICCNYLPDIRGADAGVWRRIAIVPWTQSFLGREDRDLTRKLRGEAAGVLAWVVEGAVQRLREGLEVPEVVRGEVAQQWEESDIVASFLGECCSEGCARGDETSAGSLYQAYRDWCRRTHLDTEMLGPKHFAQEMVRLGHPRDRVAQFRFYRNAQLKGGKRDAIL